MLMWESMNYKREDKLFKKQVKTGPHLLWLAHRPLACVNKITRMYLARAILVREINIMTARALWSVYQSGNDSGRS